jgi:signal transduction histidine kinase/DNA-binding response OmpR family regulator
MTTERKPRILVVEDDKGTRDLLVIHFSQEGYEVTAVANGPAALQCCRDSETLPHLVLLDITLGYAEEPMDGYDVCRSLRSDPRTAHIPIIFLTEKDKRSDRMAGLELGADDYIAKPFDFDELALRVKRVLRTTYRLQKVGERLEEVSEKEEQLKTIGEIGKLLLDQTWNGRPQALDMAHLPRVLIHHVMELLSGEASSVALVDETGQLVFQMCLDWQGQEISYLKGLTIPRGKGIIGQAAKRKEPMIVPNVRESPYFYPGIDELTGLETKSLLAVPMLHQNEIIGVIEVVNKRDGTPFTEEDARLVEAIVSFAAIAVQNAIYLEWLEEALLDLVRERVSRMAIGNLALVKDVATTFVHRLNNVVGTIPVAVQELRRLVNPENKRIAHYLGNIERDMKRLLKMADEMRRPLRSQEPEELSLNALLEEAMAQIPVPDNITVNKYLADDLPTLVAVPMHIREVLCNLFNNAIEAMPEGGYVTIRSRLVEGEWGKWIEVDVSDTGQGISPETLSGLFTLFFTTKREKGLGLGLWWCKTYLQGQGGDLVVRSKVGQGSTFTVRLPRIS